MEVTAIVDGVVVTIYDHPVEAEAEDGHPAFKNVTYIRKRVNAREVYDQPIKVEDKRDFADLYQKYQNGEKVEIDGWIIEQWPRVSTVQVATLKARNIFTVDQLAALDVSQMPRGYQELQRMAVKDLSTDKQVDELKKRIEVLEADNAKLAANQKKRPGRKKKDVAA